MMDGSRPRHHVPRALREKVFVKSNGVCQRCLTQTITIDTFHVSHLRAHANGGALVEENLEAWCTRCNFDQRATDVRDTRAKPRAWQLEALDPVVAQIAATGAATVSAAPGAGKTVFAGLVFEALRDADFVDRLIVLAPRKTIVDQWADALHRACHLELAPFVAVERPGQDGVVGTYHSLTDNSLAVHQLMTQKRTLLVLDEVHHVGEPDRAAWAKKVAELAGSVDPLNLRVTGVLNLSGTLWRSNRSEKISTVRYEESDDGRIVSVVDFKVDPEQLIRQGQLRPVDLYQLGAKVSVQDWSKFDVVETTMADLDEEVTGAALRALADNDAYREAFVSSILDRLEEIHRSLGNYHSKALIVAATQNDARRFREEVNLQMKRRGLTPLAELAVSDEPAAKTTLERFRRSTRVGVLCTVDMAGEGYDCPDIAVLGYATNKRTAMYVRQVVARAMRVTERERTVGIVPAKIVVPDIPDLVQRFVELLTPILGEIVVPSEKPADGVVSDAPPGTLFGPKYVVTDVEPVDERVSVAYSEDEVYSFQARDVAEMARELEAANLQPALAPRFMAVLQRWREARPFDETPRPPSAENHASGLRSATAPQPHQGRPEEIRHAEPRLLSIEERSRRAQGDLHRLEGWWKVHGEPSLAIGLFVSRVNEAGGIRAGGRASAGPDQLERAVAFARRAIADYCRQSGKPGPRL